MRFRLFFAALLLSAVSALLSCSSQAGPGVVPGPPGSPSNGQAAGPARLLSPSQVSDLLSPSISASSRQFLSSFLSAKKFRPGEIGSSFSNTLIVIYDSKTGSTYTNRPNVHVAPPKLTPAGSSAPIARRATVGPLSTTTGPSRRVWTYGRQYPSTPGQYGDIFAAATVTLPCTGNSAYGDQGNIYFGGYSSTGSSAPDAGLQYNQNWTAAGYSLGSGSQTYEPYFNFGPGIGYVGQYSQFSGGSWVPTTGNSIPCGSTALLEYTVNDYNSDEEAFIVGVTANGQTQYYVYLAMGSDFDGWTSDCGGCSLKEATSIAQGAQNLSNGDSFGPVQWSSVYLGCGFAVNDGCLIGNTTGASWDATHTQACDEWPYWDSTTSLEGTTDCFDSPAGADVVVTNGNYASQTVSIVLPSGSPATLPTSVPPPTSGGILNPNGTTTIPNLNWIVYDDTNSGSLTTQLALINNTGGPLTLEAMSTGSWTYCAIGLSVTINGAAVYPTGKAPYCDVTVPMAVTIASGMTIVDTVSGIGSGLSPGEANYGGPIDTTWSLSLAYDYDLNLGIPTAPTTNSANIAESNPLWSGNIDENTPTPAPTPTPSPTPVPTPKPTPTPPNICVRSPHLCLVTTRPTPKP